jgi:hypothetical protein
MDGIERFQKIDVMEMYEILVPTVFNDGKPIKTKFHKVWDTKVYTITGGLTIMTPTKGKWISPTGNLFAERMIPVRIVCNREQIEAIVDMTIDYYDQEAILAYKISDEVVLRYKSK